MLEYDRVNVSIVIDVNKIDGWHEYIFDHFWYLLETNFGFQSQIYDKRNGLMQKAIRFNDAAMVAVKGNEYRMYF